MDQAARRKHELLEAMESCRAARGELNEPQFAELAAALGEDAEIRARFTQVQRADATIEIVFADVPVPVDLAERISRRLREVGGSLSGHFSERNGTSPPALPCRDFVARSPKRFLRPRWIAGISAVAASAAVLVGLWMHFHQPSPMTRQRAVDEAMAYFSQDNGPQGDLASVYPPPADYPISPDIKRLPDVRWRRIENFLGSEAVAYDLPSVGGKATLYVVHRTVADAPTVPPPGPALCTGGKSAAAWQSGDTLYVLVLQGDAGTYDSYFVSGPLT